MVSSFRVKDSKVSPKNFKPDLLMFYAIFNWPYPSDPVEEKTENALHLAIRIFYEFYDYHVKDQTGRHTVYFKLLLDKESFCQLLSISLFCLGSSRIPILPIGAQVQI